MDLATKIGFLNRAIATQQATLRLQVGLTIGLIIFGLIVIALGLVVPGLVLSEKLKGVQTLGGAFLSTSSLVPFKDLSSRRDKIAAMVFLREQYGNLLQGPMPPDPGQVAALDPRFWQIVDKSLGG